MTRTKKPAYAIRLLLLAAAFCMTFMQAVAQEDSDLTREVINAQVLAIGSTNMLDTYLSPEKYTGVEMRYISHTLRNKPGSQWRQRIIHQGYIADGYDRSEDGSMMSGLYSLNFAIMRKWDMAEGKVEIMAGGMGDASLGATYNSRNQNNPAQMRMGTAIGPTASAAWKFHLLKKQWRLGYEVSVPLLGVMFMPNYGQSYYEIFSRGDYDHNCVITTPFNAPSLSHTLTLDAKLGSLTLRVGYLGDIVQAKANNLKQHYYTHALMIGFVKHVKITEIK